MKEQRRLEINMIQSLQDEVKSRGVDDYQAFMTADLSIVARQSAGLQLTHNRHETCIRMG